MLNEVLTWWAKQMLDLVPPGLRRRDSGPRNALLVSLSEGGPAGEPMTVALVERRGHRETERFRARLDQLDQPPIRNLLRRRLPIVLRPPKSALLEREVTLPLAAEQDLAGVLGYEMDRLTPFPAADVFWGYHVTARDSARAVLRVRLSVAARAVLRPVLAALERAGAVPALIEFPLAGGEVRRIRVAQPDTRLERRRRRGMALAAGGCGALAMAAVAQPLIRQSLALADIDSRVAAIDPRVRAVQGLRRQIADAATGADAVATEQARVGDAVQTLAAVTQILPDDTYLTSLGLQHRSLSLSGLSTEAAKLIGLLSADPMFQGAAFTAPVTRGSRGKDVFELRATIGP